MSAPRSAPKRAATTYDEATLEAMTKSELLDLASELSVADVSSKSTKAVIIAAILNN